MSPAGQAHARAHAARAAPGSFTRADLSTVQLPTGARAALEPAEALRCLIEAPGAALLRADSMRTRLAVCQALVDHLHPGTGIAVAGHGRLAERASVIAGKRIARSTVGNHLRALVADGVLHVAQHGSTAAANGGVRNLAPSYVVLASADELSPTEQAMVDQLAAELAVGDGPVDELGHLPVGQSRVYKQSPSLARRSGHFSWSDALPATPARRDHPEHYPPRTLAERRLAAAWLTATMGWSWDERTGTELAKIVSAFFAAGWSPSSVLHAWHHRPDGEPVPGPLPVPHNRDRAAPPRVRNLWAVLTWRLAAWRDPLGDPIAPPVPAEQPRRGRPRRAPAVPPAPAFEPRSAGADAEVATVRQRLAQLAAKRDAGREQAARRRAVLRARLDQVGR